MQALAEFPAGNLRLAGDAIKTVIETSVTMARLEGDHGQQ